MIERCVADGFMARHVLHWPMPDYPSYAEFCERVSNVDDFQKDAFVGKIKDFWIFLGHESHDTVIPKK